MERLTPATTPEFPGPLDRDRVVYNIDTYLSGDNILRDAQLPVFYGFRNFFAGEDMAGLVEAPTGSGKTTIFVELSKLLLDMPPDRPKPKILVVTSRIDLARQIIGADGSKGFGRFAPDLKVGSYYTESSEAQKNAFVQNDVGVTVYNSFNKLRRAPHLLSINEVEPARIEQEYQRLLSVYTGIHPTNPRMAQQMAEKGLHRAQFPDGTILSKFNVIMFDEAHNLFRAGAQATFTSLPKDVTKIAFTATSEASEAKRLITFFPHEIFRKSLIQGIESEMVSPVAAVGVATGMRIQGTNIYNSKGEFIDRSLTYLARDPERNRRVVQAAKFLAGLGMRGTVACIPGEGMWHARHIADLLREEGITAVAVHSAMNGERRKEIYQKFELDDDGPQVLTFIDIIGEGWDSPRSKFGVHARPTRGLLNARQRPGRQTRWGSMAVIVDMVDEYTSDNMSITMADVIGKGAIPFGTVFGNPSDKDKELLAHIVKHMGEVVPVLPVLPNHYANHLDLLRRLPDMMRESHIIIDGVKYALPTGVNPRYHGINEDILLRAAQLTGMPLRQTAAKRGSFKVMVYSVNDAGDILRTLPEVDPDKYYIDKHKNKWLTPTGIVKLFGKRYPDVTEAVLTELIENSGAVIDWQPGRINSARAYETKDTYRTSSFKVTPLFPYNQSTIDIFNEALAQYYNS